MGKLILFLMLIIPATTYAGNKNNSNNNDKIRNDAIIQYQACSVTFFMYKQSGSDENYKELLDCEKKLDKLIKKAINGNNAIYDGITNEIAQGIVSDSDITRQYALKYDYKLNQAMMRSKLKKGAN